MVEAIRLGEKLADIVRRAPSIGECSVMDFKAEPHSKAHDCELFKDVLALANSFDRPREDRWLVYGVSNKGHIPVGVDDSSPDLLDEAAYQQKFKKISPHLHIELVRVPADGIMGERGAGKSFVAFYIPGDSLDSVYELCRTVEDDEPDKRGKFCKYYPGTSFIRLGSSTELLLEEHRARIRKVLASTVRQPTAFPDGSDGSLVPAVGSERLYMLGSWDEKNDADRALVGALCGCDYDSAVGKLGRELDAGVFAVRGSRWDVHDRAGALAMVGKRLTGNTLLSLSGLLGASLSSLDGMYAMPEGDRPLADVKGVNRGCSVAAREGVASFCACLSNNRGLVPNCTGDDVDRFLSNVMSSVFSSDDWRVYASADSVMPLLAEASPNLYLAYLERGMSEDGPLASLFRQRSGGIAFLQLGSGLVYGVRIAATQGEALSRAIRVLVALSRFTSLAKDAVVGVLLPWLPQTSASAETRKGMGKYLAEREEPAAWDSLLDLLPGRTRSAIGVSEASYLPLPDFEEPASLAEYWDVERAYCRSALVGARGDIDRMRAVFSCLEGYRLAGLMDELVESLLAAGDLAEGERYPLWRDVVSYMERRRAFGGSEDVPSEDEISGIVTLSERIAPRDPYFEALRLCSGGVTIASRSGDGLASFDELLSLRVESLRGLYAEKGLDALLGLIGDGADGYLFGSALAHLPLPSSDVERVLALLDGGRVGSHAWRLPRSFAWGMLGREGWDWVDSLSRDGWPAERVAGFFAALPLEEEGWRRAEAELGEDSHLYWSEVDTSCRFEGAEDAEYCARRLIFAGRASFAVEVTFHAVEGGLAVAPEVAMDALSALGPSDLGSMGSYYAQGLFEYLEKIAPCDRLCALEFQYSGLLRDRADAYLFRRMSEDPDLFVETVSMAYATPDDDVEKTVLSSDARLTMIYLFLPCWKVVPGCVDGENFDDDKFEAWLDAVREKADGQGCLDGAEYQIGRNLFYAPLDRDGFFIPVAAARFIESSERARSGYDSETVNSRGAHFVDCTGGEDDKIADSYEEKAAAAEARGFVNFAVTLRHVSSMYRREAQEAREGR